MHRKGYSYLLGGFLMRQTVELILKLIAQLRELKLRPEVAIIITRNSLAK